MKLKIILIVAVLFVAIFGFVLMQKNSIGNIRVEKNVGVDTSLPSNQVYQPGDLYCENTDIGSGDGSEDPNGPKCASNESVIISYNGINDFLHLESEYDHCERGTPTLDSSFKPQNSEGKNYFTGTVFNYSCELNDKKVECQIKFGAQSPECGIIDGPESWPGEGEQDDPQVGEFNSFCRVGDPQPNPPLKPSEKDPNSTWTCVTQQNIDGEIDDLRKVCFSCSAGEINTLNYKDQIKNLELKYNNIDSIKKAEFFVVRPKLPREIVIDFENMMFRIVRDYRNVMLGLRLAQNNSRCISLDEFSTKIREAELIIEKYADLKFDTVL